MKKEAKAKIIDSLQDSFKRSNVCILTNYRGMKTGDMLEVRKKLRAVDGKFEVVKNTMANFAAEKIGKKQISRLLTETTAAVFGFGEIRDLAAALNDYIRVSKSPLVIKGGLLGDRMLTPDDVITLASIPSKQVLIAMFMGGLQMPLTMLAGQLNAPISGLANVLRARKKQLEGDTD